MARNIDICWFVPSWVNAKDKLRWGKPFEAPNTNCRLHVSHLAQGPSILTPPVVFDLDLYEDPSLASNCWQVGKGGKGDLDDERLATEMKPAAGILTMRHNDLRSRDAPVPLRF